MQELTRITILEARAREAMDVVKKFVKKARRYGVEFNVVFGETYVITVDEQVKNDLYFGRKRRMDVRVLDLIVKGEKPKVGDYDFVASVEMTPGGNFVDVVPGEEIPPVYRAAPNNCEHCKTTRRRKHVFVVRSRETGEYVQVGRTCLRDFLGIDDPRHILQWFKYFRAITDPSGGWSDWGYGSPMWAEDLRYMMVVTLSCVRIWGWASKGQADRDETITPTVSRFWSIYAKEGHALEEGRKIRAEIKESDWDAADQIVDFVRGSTEESDYMHNLRVAFHDDYVCDPKRAGLVVSAVAAWHRAQEREIQRVRKAETDAKSEHLGSQGERLRGLEVRLEHARDLGWGQFGPSTLFKFRDDAGNVLTWITGGGLGIDIGESAVIDGTVKAHKEWNGVKETQLTRVAAR